MQTYAKRSMRVLPWVPYLVSQIFSQRVYIRGSFLLLLMCCCMPLSFSAAVPSLRKIRSAQGFRRCCALRSRGFCLIAAFLFLCTKTRVTFCRTFLRATSRVLYF